MSAPGWEDIAAIAEDLLDLEVGQREAELVRRCGGNAALESGVRKLIGDIAKADSGEFLAQPVLHGDALATGLKGASIGGFDLLDVLGEGGMGVVFKARQRKPERDVAIKVLRPTYATKSAVRRFEIEAEILGRLQHPAIASVIASGVHRFSGGGLGFELPWYAMELLDGARDLVRFAREERLSVDAKLALFTRVCDAVHHAHQRGVIHRDLKPANILIDAAGSPKVIDFGIAHTTEMEGTRFRAHSGGTSAFDLLGTLRYMAPEQVDGRADRVDVRTDVYALGVVLFEFLTGESPIVVDDSTLDEALRAIRHDPPRLPKQLLRELPRELDWIVDKCLAKEPEQRYESVAALIQDLERLRRREVLSVGPPDLSYRIRTYVRRNRIAVAIATVAGIVLSAWIVSLSAALERARDAETEASQRAAEAQSEAEKLRAVRDYFGVAVDRARKKAAGIEVPFRAVLDELETAIESHDLPTGVSAVMATDVANYYLDLDRVDRAIELLRRSLERLRAAGLETSFEASKALTALARAEERSGDLGAAKASIEKIEGMDRSSPSDRVEFDLSALKVEWERVRQAMATEHFEEAERRLREMLVPFERGVMDPGNNAQVIRGGLALVLSGLGRFEEAEVLARSTLEADRKAYGEGSARAANSLTLLASIRNGLGSHAEALAMLEQALPILTAELPKGHRYVLAAMEQQALAKQKLGALDEALTILESTLPDRLGDGGKLTRDAMLTISRIGRVLVDLGHLEAAEQRLVKALADSKESLGEDHLMRAAVAAELGRVLVLRGRGEEGQPMIATALERLKAHFSVGDPRVREIETWLEKARAGTLSSIGNSNGK